MGNLDFLARAAPKSGSSLFDRFAKRILEQEATIADHALNDRLTKNLVMKYVHAEQKLNDLNEQKNRFLGIAAHDLRNPLVSIRGFSELLLEGGLDEESRKEFLGLINTLSDETLTLLNDLLDISVIESGKFNLSMETGDLVEIVRTKARLQEPVAANKKIKIETSFDKAPDITFDKSRIGQVIDNLISNAIKFSPSGTTILVSVTVKSDVIETRVKDEGQGIPDKEIDKLFGEFQRTSVTPTGGEKSTGLGLAIVKKIIEAHNGLINVTSKVGEGSEFYFTLPLNL